MPGFGETKCLSRVKIHERLKEVLMSFKSLQTPEEGRGGLT